MEAFEKKLVAKVSEPEAYQSTMAAIPANIREVQGSVGYLGMHVLKSSQPLTLLHGNEAGPLNEVKIDARGLETVDGLVRDRMAMVVRFQSGSNGAVGEYQAVRFSQKDSGALAQVGMGYDPEKAMLRMFAPNTSEISPLDFSPSVFADSSEQSIRIHFPRTDTVVAGVPIEGPVVDKLKEILTFHDVRFDDIGIVVSQVGALRPSDTFAQPQNDILTDFSDGAQLHVTSSKTLDFLNECARRSKGRAVPMSTFRPNLVLYGEQMLANAEDVAEGTAIETDHGSIHMAFASLTPRCSVTTLDPKTGTSYRDGEPLRTLKKFRPTRPWDGKVTFGANAHIEEAFHGQVISVGDEVKAISRKETWRLGADDED